MGGTAGEQPKVVYADVKALRRQLEELGARGRINNQQTQATSGQRQEPPTFTAGR